MPIQLGSNKIGDIQVSGNTIGTAYVGGKLVYQKTSTAIIILIQPATQQTAYDGDSVSFTCVASGGSAALYYYWYKTTDLNNCVGTGSTWSFDCDTADAGSYRCKVTDGTHTVWSNDGSLDVKEVVITITGLSDKSIYIGNSATFSCSATINSGATPIYTWSNGETTSSITVTEAGTYTVTVSDGKGHSKTASAKLTVNSRSASITSTPIAAYDVLLMGYARKYLISPVPSDEEISHYYFVINSNKYDAGTKNSYEDNPSDITAGEYITHSVYGSVLWSNGQTAETSTYTNLKWVNPTAIISGGKDDAEGETYGTIYASIAATPNLTGLTKYYTWYERTSTSGEWEKLASGGPTVIDDEVPEGGYRQFKCEVVFEDSYGNLSDTYTYLYANTRKSYTVTITQNPTSVTVYDGYSATFSCKASGGIGDLHYTWSSGDTGSTLTIDNCTTSVSGTQYYCTASDDSSHSAVSTSATLTVKSVTITSSVVISSPTSTIYDGDKVVFKCTGGISPSDVPDKALSYLWLKNGTSTGVTTSTYMIDSCTTSMNGDVYSCIVSDTHGHSQTSNGVTLTVTETVLSASISKSISGTIYDGNELTLTCNANYKGSGTLTYTWNDGTAGSTYKFSSIKITDSGTYTCKIDDGNGHSTTASITISVTAVVITASISPSSISIYEGSDAKFICTASANNGAVLYYTWSNGSTGNTLSLTDCSTSASGTYTCTVKDSNGHSKSVSATLEVSEISVVITTQPENVSVTEGGTAQFTCVGYATDGSDVTYEWYNSNDQKVGNTSTLTLDDITADMDGNSYYCRVSTKSGEIYTDSDSATLAVEELSRIVTLASDTQNAITGTNIIFTATPSTEIGLEKYVFTDADEYELQSGSSSILQYSEAATAGDVSTNTITVTAYWSNGKTATASITANWEYPVATIHNSSTSTEETGTYSLSILSSANVGLTIVSYAWAYLASESSTEWISDGSSSSVSGTLEEGEYRHYRCVVTYQDQASVAHTIDSEPELTIEREVKTASITYIFVATHGGVQSGTMPSNQTGIVIGTNQTIGGAELYEVTSGAYDWSSVEGSVVFDSDILSSSMNVGYLTGASHIEHFTYSITSWQNTDGTTYLDYGVYAINSDLVLSSVCNSNKTYSISDLVTVNKSFTLPTTVSTDEGIERTAESYSYNGTSYSPGTSVTLPFPRQYSETGLTSQYRFDITLKALSVSLAVDSDYEVFLIDSKAVFIATAPVDASSVTKYVFKFVNSDGDVESVTRTTKTCIWYPSSLSGDRQDAITTSVTAYWGTSESATSGTVTTYWRNPTATASGSYSSSTKKITVTATCSGRSGLTVAYQWQVKTSSTQTDWHDITGTGGNTATYTSNALSSGAYRAFRCVVTFTDDTNNTATVTTNTYTKQL